MKTIVTLVDLSEVTFKLLKHAHALAKAFDSNVVIVHVVPKEPIVVGLGVVSPTILRDPSPESFHTDQTKLQELKESLTKFGIHVTTAQMAETNIEDVVKYIESLEADLVIMGSHGHGAFYNLFIGSVAADMVKRIQSPVLLVPV